MRNTLLSGLAGLIFLSVVAYVVSAMAAPVIVTSSTGQAAYGTIANVLTVIGRAINVAVSPGALTLLGTKDVVVSVPGVLLGDTIMCNLASAPNLSSGVTMSECHVSAADTVTFRFSALVGLTLGTFNYNVIWLR